MILSIPLTQNLEAESAVLGAVLIKASVIDEIAHLVDPRDFTIHAHQMIWKAMKHQYQNNKPIDIVTLSHMLQTYKRLEEVGGVTYLTELAQAVPTTSNTAYYANIVRSHAIRRRGAEAGEKIIQLASGGEIEDDEDFFTQVEQLALNIRPQTANGMKSIRDGREAYMEHLRRQDELIPTGFKRFDNWSGGLGRDWLYILAGRPSVGKTAKMLQMARGIAEQDKGEVLIWSQEMSREQLINRMIIPITAIPAGRFRRRNFQPGDEQKISDAYDCLEMLPLHIEDASNVSIEEIRATARQIKRRHGKLAAIFVDYLTIMKIPQEKGKTWSQAVGEVTKQAKHLAREMDCPFVLLAQMNRESKKVQRPGLEHLKDSGNIEQDADVVEFLWEDPEDHDPGYGNNGAKVVHSVIAKGRDIGINDFRYIFKGWLQKYEEG
ncbi:replicative DNA helicase [Marininema halotolerans]|uniref:DNA 5'-3' helicase n=2 Tax=Marininema halotolerans TaxID=1155944 RepID=A0A1I6UQD0_9BACL|nr:DnaB-like helicase C-terminal domain-containing protein [Marininema halotolerans]SFT03685.1 replicative DNA helicase [Marininema halotolerans]